MTRFLTKAAPAMVLALALGGGLGGAETASAAGAHRVEARVASPAAPTFFQSPSKNIGCGMTRGAVGCQILERTYTPPPQPASCDLDWGNVLQLRKKAHFVCYSDSINGIGKVLRYGRSKQIGHMQCTSRRAGMTCRNLNTGHGFRLSRGSYDRF